MIRVGLGTDLAFLRAVVGALKGVSLIAIPSGVRVLVATKPVELASPPVGSARGADGLAALAFETLKQDPFKGVVLVFRAKRADRVKIVTWDGSGLVMVWKRLDQGVFRWPPVHRRGDAAEFGSARGVAGGAGLVEGLCAAPEPPDGGPLSCGKMTPPSRGAPQAADPVVCSAHGFGRGRAPERP